jgi:hypothetical protein
MNKYTLAAFVLGLLTPLSLSCQQPRRASEADCTKAIAVSQRTDFRAEADRDLGMIRQCGSRGAAALGQMLTRTSRGPTTREFSRTVDVALGFRDASIFDASLALASDRAAQSRARAQAFRVLISMIDGMRVTYESLTTRGGLCSIYSLPDVPATNNRALSSDYLRRIKKSAEAARDDVGAPKEVRSAAECALTVVRGVSLARPN